MAQERPLVAPTPDGRPLTLDVPCRTTTNPRVAPARHLVHIRTDWTVEVPHDLDAERIARAFGGHVSCVGLVEQVVPALRYWLGVRLAAHGRLLELRGSEWVVADRAACCRDVAFVGATTAVGHVQSVPHAANRFGADVELLAVLAAAVLDAWGDALSFDPRDPFLWRACATCLGGITDVEYLFRVGLRPGDIVAIHRAVGADTALPRAFYLAVAGGALDPADGIGSVRGLDDRAFHTGDVDELTAYLRQRALIEGTP